MAAAVLGASATGAVGAPQADGDGDGDGDGLTVHVPGAYYTQVSDPVRVALPVTVDAGSGASVRGVTLTVDASEVKGVVRLYAKRACTEGAGYVFTCRLTSSRQHFSMVDLVVLGADKAAEPGRHGTVRLTATGPDGQRAEAETVMTAGSPELWGRKLSIEDAAADKPVVMRGGILNHGSIAATGFGVTVSAGPGLEIDRGHRNCRYTETSQSRAYCFFDTRVEPGKAYDFDAPFVLRGGKDLTKSSVIVNIFAPGQDAGPYFNEAEYTVPGTGPELGLKPTEPKGFSPDFSHVPVVTTQHVDIQAVAGDLRGRTGDIVQLKVGLRNGGPGQVSGRYLRYLVVPPEGTTLIPPEKPSPDPEADEEPYWICGPWEPGAKRYSCAGKGLRSGESDTEVLRFRIDEETGAGAAGRVQALVDGGYAERDPDKDNNVAAITVNGREETAKTTDDDGSGGMGWGRLAAGVGAAGVLVLVLAAVPYGIWRRRGQR